MTGTRERIVTATNELFRRQGYNGTSLKDITGAADATTGSVYHFWPGGKDDLTVEVLMTSGAAYGELFEAVLDEDDDIGRAVAAFFDAGADVLETTDFIDPCPIGTVAREVASTHDGLRAAAHAVFDGWVDVGAARFERAGLPPERARELAAVVIAAVEGGFVLARTTRDTAAFRAIGRQLHVLIDATLTATERIGR